MHTNTPKSTAPSPLKVLLVEDDAAALEELAEIVEEDGWSALCAQDLSQAMAFLEAHRDISIVVTDFHIVEADGTASNGIQLASRAAAQFPGRSFGFVVLSGDPSVVGASIQNGAVDFLMKPVVAEDIVRAIRIAGKDAGKERTVAELTSFLMTKVQSTTRALQDVRETHAEQDALFSEAQRASEVTKKTAADIRKALEDGQIKPWFQPQISLTTGRIMGLEALARWDRPDHSDCVGAEFLSIVDDVGMLEEVDTSLRAQAIRSVRGLERSGVSGCDVGLNFTAQQLADPAAIDHLLQAAEAVGLSPDRIVVEILETSLIDADLTQEIQKNISRLSKCGVRVDLDDFGTGSAGISSLRDFAIDRVKIDASFVSNVHVNTELQAYTRALIALAKKTGIKVLAEGVECAAELDWLRSEGCDMAQGYYIAKPMPLEMVLSWSLDNIATTTAAVAS